ncbi:unnamed protein product [Arctia plantaginis]|uniref:MARVEL domain-containing protein n=1 Tax=Arctia plantaginis TaxID=874455 RepID=A0A8S1AXE4_ARCPL|nr:unnamed protein product [Arctia plantaginis]CAB3257984.1 unnamed protein product [Arctia plantaginis]
MDASPPQQEVNTTVPCAHSDQPGDRIFRQYYTDTDYVLSLEGILKLLSAIVCVISSVLLLTNGTCRTAPSLIPSASFVALSCGIITVVFYGVIVLDLSLYSPQVCLLTDIILSAVMGVLLFLMAVLTMTVCEMIDSISYVHGPLGIVNAGMLLGSAVITYVSVMRRWDALHTPYEPTRPIPTEQDV